MTRRVELTPRARIQLSNSAAWWAENRSLAQAAKWLRQINLAITALAGACERFPHAPESKRFARPLYQMNFGISSKPTHRVVFAVFDERVLIYAVRHLAQRPLTADDLSEGVEG